MPGVFFNGEKLEWVRSICYLGIIIDDQLKFKQQCSTVLSKLSGAYGIFWAISSYFPKKFLMNIFYSIVYPILIQNIVIWGGTYQSYLVKISTNLNTILRLILKVSFNEDFRSTIRTNYVYIELNVLKFNDIYRYFLLKFIHFYMYRRTDIFIE